MKLKQRYRISFRALRIWPSQEQEVKRITAMKVFKKQSPNGRLTVYLSNREFVNENGMVSQIDGVVLLDPLNLKDRKVFALVVLTFRYGREDEEVMGLKFYTEAILDFKQVFPQEEESKTNITPLQQNLMRKLGNDAYPVTLSISNQAPHSVRLQPARVYNGSPLGVTYDLKVFVGQRPDEKPHKRGMVRMSLRCVHLAPDLSMSAAPPPSIAISKNFVFSPGRLEVEAVLDKEIYDHGDPMHVHITVNNNCNRTVQKIKVVVLQHVNVCMFTNGRFKNIVGVMETEDRHPIPPGASLSRDFCIKLMSFLKYPVALAIEGGLPDDAINLAPSTLPAYAKEKNPYGVTVSYEVKIKAILGYVDRTVTLRLPFKILNKRSSDPDEGTSFDTRKQTKALSSDILETDDCISDDISRLVLLQT